jgi:hypothetical protein
MHPGDDHARAAEVGVTRLIGMDTVDIESAYEALGEAAAFGPFADPVEGEWSVDQVLAHVTATSRIIAAACAELLAGRVPVVDHRPTQSLEYLDAIITSVGDRGALVLAAERAGSEVTMLAAKLNDAQLATNVPTIILDAGVIRLERPVAFSVLLGPDHVRAHVEQVRSLRS